MTTELKSLMGYPICDEVARTIASDLGDRITALEEGSSSGTEPTVFQESGDLFTLLSDYELVDMKKAGYRINKSGDVYVEQAYANNSIHYFDISNLQIERLLIRCHQASWGNICYYNPSDETYTLIRSFIQGNAGGLLNLSIPSGCYLAFSSSNANYTTGKHSYLRRLWLNPSYTSKFDGLDETVKPIPVELANVDYSGYPYFYIDMEKYTNCMVRFVQNSGPTNVGWQASDSIDNTDNVSVSAGFGNFFPWVCKKKYLILFFRNNNFVDNPINISMAWIDPKKAVEFKKKNYWGSRLMAHNADTMTELIHACVWSWLIDIDLCKTLDDYYVAMHGTTINNKSIPSTNLADLNLTYNQFEISDVIDILKTYDVFCFFNFRNTTPEQDAEVSQRLFNTLGRGGVYDASVANTASPLYGNCSKFYIIKDGVSLANIKNAGADMSKVIGSIGQADTDFNKYSILNSTSVTVTSKASLPAEGDYFVCQVYSGTTAVLNG